MVTYLSSGREIETTWSWSVVSEKRTVVQLTALMVIMNVNYNLNVGGLVVVLRSVTWVHLR